MKGKILLLCALPVIGYVGVKLYLHIQVGKTVDAMVAQVTPYADVSYESVTSTFDGRIGVSNVKIRPRMVDDEIRIREVSFKLPSMMYLLELEKRVQNQDPPDELSVKVHDVALSTRGKLIEAWEDQMFADDSAGRLAAFDNCVTRTNLPTQMYLLNYDEIRGSFEVGYYYDHERGHFVVHGTAGQIDAYEFKGDLAVVMPAFDAFAMMNAFSNPQIAQASLEITDSGYFDRVFDYCANDDQLQKQDVVALLTEDLLEMFDEMPMKPDQLLIDAYTQFITDGSRIKITAHPNEPQKLQYLSLYAPEDVPALLNIQTQVN
ncbi:MAG: hypothetical protein OES38_00950 [Gammaproteobacteria bacterium]|nr:hypothetical protein [Gammaproteobacteria bacterium]